MAILKLTANGTGRTVTFLTGATPTSYFLMVDSDWGNADFQTTYGGARARMGSRPAFAVAQNRTIKHHFRVRGGATKDGVAQALQAAYIVAEDVRRFGGSLLWQSGNQTYRQTFDILTLLHDIDWSGNNGENLLRPEFTIMYTAAPYAQGDPMDTVDDFSTDTITAGNWTKDGAFAMTVSSGTAHLSSGGSLTRYRHSLKGYPLGDVEVTLKVNTASSITSCVWGVAAKLDMAGADTGIVAELVAGTNVIRVRKYIAGTGTDLATAAFTPAINTTYWVRLRIEGTKVTAEVYTSLPTPTATAAASAVYTKTADEASRFAAGHTGMRITGTTNDTFDDFSSKPYTYKLISSPEHVALVGPIPGDVAAQADIEVTPLGGSATPIYGMAGMLERPQINNLVWNGDFENATIGTGGWVATAVSGVIAAATSVARDTTAARVKYGSGDLQVVCPATTDTGASFQIFRRFRRSCTYAILVWASSAAGTTVARAKLGVSGDLGTGNSAALSATPKPYSVIWQPTADRDFAYAAFGVAAATATTLNIDGVCVVENPTILALSGAVSTSATSLPIYSTPSDLPALPFLAMVDQELYRVTAATGTTWTVEAGAEGSIDTSHSSGAQVVILPPLAPRRQYEGAGAMEPMDIIEAEGYVAALSSVTGSVAVGSSTDLRGGNDLQWTGMTAGATGSFVWLIDPSLLVADDYSLGEVDVEVWLRWAANVAVSSLKVNASCVPDGGSAKGAERFTREWGNVGRLLTLNNANSWRYSRLGVIPLIVDQLNPLRWQLKLAITPAVAAAISLDYLELVPVRYRVSGPTGKANDTASGSGAYPSVIPYDSGWGSTSAMTKLLRADGSGLINELGKPPYPDHGLGRVIECPRGDCDLITKLSNLVPDDPTADSTVEMFTGAPSYASTWHVAPTPRFALIRGS